MIGDDEYLERLVAGIQAVSTGGADVRWNEELNKAAIALTPRADRYRSMWLHRRCRPSGRTAYPITARELRSAAYRPKVETEVWLLLRLVATVTP